MQRDHIFYQREVRLRQRGLKVEGLEGRKERGWVELLVVLLVGDGIGGKV